MGGKVWEGERFGWLGEKRNEPALALSNPVFGPDSSARTLSGINHLHTK